MIIAMRVRLILDLTNTPYTVSRGPVAQPGKSAGLLKGGWLPLKERGSPGKPVVGGSNPPGPAISLFSCLTGLIM